MTHHHHGDSSPLAVQAGQREVACNVEDGVESDENGRDLGNGQVVVPVVQQALSRRHARQILASWRGLYLHGWRLGTHCGGCMTPHM